MYISKTEVLLPLYVYCPSHPGGHRDVSTLHVMGTLKVVPDVVVVKVVVLLSKAVVLFEGTGASVVHLSYMGVPPKYSIPASAWAEGGLGRTSQKL